MLRRCHFMMGCLNLYSHILQCEHHIPSRIFSQIEWPKIKISRLLMRCCRRCSIIILMEKEKFKFRSDYKLISHFFGFPNYIFQDLAWVALVRCSVRTVDITDKSCHFSLLRPPWENGKCIQVRPKIHVWFFDPRKSFNWRSVKHAFIIQCSFKLSCSDRHIFQCTVNVSKLQTDKSDIFFFHQTQNIFSCIISHNYVFLHTEKQTAFW